MKLTPKAYLEKGNYKYTAILKHFEKYLVSDNSLLAKDIKLDDIYKIMDFNSLNSHLIKQILDETTWCNIQKVILLKKD